MIFTKALEITTPDGVSTGRYRLVEFSDEHDGVEPLCDCGGRASDSPKTAGHATPEEACACPVARAKLGGPLPVANRTFDFGAALARMRSGSLVQRAGWNGKGMWLRYVDLYNDKEFSLREDSSARGTWLPFIAMKTVDNGLVPWLASQTDILAMDWSEVKP